VSPGSFGPPGNYAPPGNYGQPANYGQPPPGFGYSGFGPLPTHLQPIPSYLWQSIVVTLFCCVPTGVVAIVAASKVQSRQQYGDIRGALDASRNARTWCVVSLVLGILGYLVFILLAVIGSNAGRAAYTLGGIG
jgi:hypothetical protein